MVRGGKGFGVEEIVSVDVGKLVRVFWGSWEGFNEILVRGVG